MRLFAALNLPDTARHDITSRLQQIVMRHELPVRCLPAESLHITVKFLGEVSAGALPQLAAALESAAAGTRPFDVAIGGLGAFPSSSRPRIFWVGVAAAPALLRMHRSIEEACAAIGFARDARAYRPHITVAKLQPRAAIKDRSLVDRLAEEFDYTAVVRARSVDLMRSRVSSHGAEYEVLQTMELS